MSMFTNGSRGRKVLASGFLGAVFLFAGMANAVAEGEWMVRVRALNVTPDESSTIEPIGGSATVRDKWVPEVDFTYFFNKNIAVELILATARHRIGATGTALGDLDIGKVNLLPPTLTAQYHFDNSSNIKPYLGAGLNYTMFFNSDTINPALTRARYKDSVGFALQAGTDIEVSDNLYLNLDVKKVFLNTKATISTDGLGTVTADVDIDPWIFGAGFGIRF